MMTKRYLKCEAVDSPLDGGHQYLELVDGITMRSMDVYGNQIRGSNIKYPDFGIGLPEGRIDIDEVIADQPFQVQEITAFEFDALWSKHLQNHLERWNETKGRFPIGSETSCIAEVFFPHGVMVVLETGELGVIRWTPDVKRNLYDRNSLRTEIKGLVTDFDEQYQWVVIESLT